MIQADLADASDEERAMFARVVIPPEKWRQTPYGDEEGGFWAVAVYENRVLWYNNIEEGLTSRRSAATARYQKTSTGITRIGFTGRCPI